MSVKVPLDTSGNAWMLVDLLLLQPTQFTEVLHAEQLGGEGSRTPVLKTIVPNFYMLIRS